MITVRKPIPTIITSAATRRPVSLVGTRSPYPTVVTVWMAHHSPAPMLGKFVGSVSVISSPPMIVTDTVTVATIPAARYAVRRLRARSFAARAWTRGGPPALP